MRNGDALSACGSSPTLVEQRQEGFTYIGLLIVVAIIGIFLSAAGTVWHVAAQREKEQQLLFVGEQMRAAIGRFYNAKAGQINQYPQTLADLLRDPRAPGVERYLRELYVDPISGTADWGLVRDADDRIMGVYSLSDEHPIKLAGFSADDKGFEGKEKYSQWVFVYQPKRVRNLARATPSL